MSTQNPDPDNYYDMPDDEVMGMSAPHSVPNPVVNQPDGEEEEEVTEPVATEPVVETSPVTDLNNSEVFNTPDDQVTSIPNNAAAGTVGNPVTDTPGETVEAPVTEPVVSTEPDYKAFYDKLLNNPIRANGKDITLRSPEEVERLIQMGLNYTKKMQSWQPRIKLITMLENHNLLDETKIAHLIDLSKGNTGAIQKLLVDNKFDPVGIDTEQAASYKPGNHRVSDSEIQFNAVLDEIESSESGNELISAVANQWDAQSKQAVYQDPTILQVINEQRATGIYARINQEIDRLSALGHLNGIPYLQAYKSVGEMLNDQGLLVPETKKPITPAVPVATRVAAPVAAVTNSDRARAVSPTRATGSSNTAPTVNYLDLPDEEFLKQMSGRT